MLSHWAIGLTLSLIIALANSEALRKKPHQFIFYRDVTITALNEELFKEALQAADLNSKGLELKALREKHHKLHFYHEIEVNGNNRALFAEALQAADLNPTGIELDTLREKHLQRTSFSQAFFVNKSGLNCRIDYTVAIYKGLRVSKYLCVNMENDDLGTFLPSDR